MLPLDVLQQAQRELVDWRGCGMSVLEMSHRGPEFLAIIQKAERDLRTLMKVPDSYKARQHSREGRGGRSAAAWRWRWRSLHLWLSTSARLPGPPSPPPSQVLFLQGGASTQFAALPLNFAPEGAVVDYVLTGAWSVK